MSISVRAKCCLNFPLTVVWRHASSNYRAYVEHLQPDACWQCISAIERFFSVVICHACPESLRKFIVADVLLDNLW